MKCQSMFIALDSTVLRDTCCELGRKYSETLLLTCTVYRLKKSRVDDDDVVLKLAVVAEDNVVVT